MIIRSAGVADAHALAEAAVRMFNDTYLSTCRPDDVATYVANAFGLAQQRAELQGANRTTLLVEDAAAVIGYAQLMRGDDHPPCVSGPQPVELSRFYVDRAWHGRGIAAQLMHAAEDAARTLGGKTLWLGVWEHNVRAIAFYARCGFVDAGMQDFWMGADQQHDRVLVRPLAAP